MLKSLAARVVVSTLALCVYGCGVALYAPTAGAATVAESQRRSEGEKAVSAVGVKPTLSKGVARLPLPSTRLRESISGKVFTPTRKGQWRFGTDGGVFAYGEARFYGSHGGKHLNAPVVGIAATPSGRGYWLAGADGGVFAYGDARFSGSGVGKRFNAPLVGVAPTPSGRGYWLAGADGGVFAYGDARFYGSGVGIHFNASVAGIVATKSGRGYWLVGADGGVFAYGDARTYKAIVRPLVVDAPNNPGVSAYRAGTIGYDISWPQCGRPLPAGPPGFAVVGINNGHMYSRNPCLGEQAAWAGKSLSLYVNVDGLPNDATSGMSGPAGQCVVSDIRCRSYNYGRNSLRYNEDYANQYGLHAPIWWLDVEVEPIWRNGDPASNAEVIRGVVDGLRSHGHTVGIYSTNYQWGVITGGGYQPRTPIWVPGASNLREAQQHCSPSYAFGGGSTWITQWTTDFDYNYACRVGTPKA